MLTFTGKPAWWCRQLWQDPALPRRYGEQARERFNALFTSTRMVSSYADIYRELAGHD
ncbi:MAG: glycosyltransferase [Sodalis sp. (in: enterobacteria)]|uniref:glycosyltransferase n=1 Tax=Sodalis sp. (in: enterobacteria) TaxID=1898979 RepID=UPI003F3DDC3B